jgi:hypothetical protein
VSKKPVKKPEAPWVLNRIAHYVDARTGKLLYSIPFYDPDNIYIGSAPYKPGDPYKSEAQYLKEINNDKNKDQ